MCGIAGIIHYSDKKSVEAHTLKGMARAIKHRGPDDQGFYIKNHVGLAHQRLSIIDLSSAGHQPMSNEDGTVWIVFNGEIYNFQELRPDLEKKGHVFRSHTDTETIIHLYEEKGIACVNDLEGMFAFALWDEKKQELFLVRDRAGEKPLLYANFLGRLVFASEIPAILASLSQKPKINISALHHYFTHSYFTPPAPLTIFSNIHKLPPAHILHLNAEGKVNIFQYWNPHFSPKWKATDKAYIDSYLDLLYETVRKQLISDVPLGVMLSGGIDSSSLVVAMRQIGAQHIRTYALGKGHNDPELIRARMVAKQLQTEHSELIFTPKNFSALPLLLENHGEPVNLLPILYSQFLVKKMRKEVSVVLSGSGGDEIFGGYDYYREILLLDRLAQWGIFIPPFFLSLLRKTGVLSPLKNVQNLAKLLSLPPEKRKAFLYQQSASFLLKNLYSPETVAVAQQSDPSILINEWFAKAQSKRYIEKVLSTDLMIGNIPSTVLVGDIAGMSEALEIRSPFLSHHMIEFAAKLPVHWKVHSMRNCSLNKFIMRRAMEPFLPRVILYSKKMGFGYNIRWSTWIRTDWRPLMKKFLFERALPRTGLFNMSFIQKAFREHLQEKNNYATLLMGLVIFDLWYEHYYQSVSTEELIHECQL